MNRPSRSTKLGSRNSPGPLEPTPVGSNPGMSGLRTNVGPPPTHRTPPAIRETQYEQCRSNSASDPSSEPPPPECEDTTSRRSSSIVPTEIGENDSGYLEAAGSDVMSRFLPDCEP